MRILTWNTRGSCSSEKMEELVGILNYWENKNDPVEIICLQELSVNKCTIVHGLNRMGYQCFEEREGYNNSGDNQLIAVSPAFAANKNWNSKIIDLPLDESDKALKLRLPMGVDWSDNRGKGLIITYHAPRFNRTCSILQELNCKINSEFSQIYTTIYLAGDLNLEDTPFTRFTTRYSHKLDHILAWNGHLKDGRHSERSNSDHLPISAHFQ